MNKLISAYGLSNDTEVIHKTNAAVYDSINSYGEAAVQGHLVHVPSSEFETRTTEQITDTNRSSARTDYGKH